MVGINFSTAVSEIRAIFLEVWQIEAEPIADHVPELRWDVYKAKERPDKSKYFAIHTISSISGNRPNLSSSTMSPDQKEYTKSGLVSVQLFAPITASNSQNVLRELGDLALKTYKDVQTPSGIWFRAAARRDILPDTFWYRANVVINYVYEGLP